MSTVEAASFTKRYLEQQPKLGRRSAEERRAEPSPEGASSPQPDILHLEMSAVGASLHVVDSEEVS